jgi:ribosomal protein S18 acetylase RimI-like enzyme
MESESASIRPYRASDLDALYRVCLQTADNGQDASSLYRDPWLPGHVYAAPYGLFQPGLAFVAADEAGVGGYIVAALDSVAFEERLERDWWPRLRGRYPDPPPAAAGERWTPDQVTAHQIHAPWSAAAGLAGSYPSHLHINLLPRLQGRGHGRALVAALAGALRSAGSPGVHLHVSPANQRAVAFYRHLGFAPVPGAASPALAMDLRDGSEAAAHGANRRR